jgi:hypothetical protein
MEEQTRDVSVGDAVIWHDSRGNPYNALVTAAWSKTCLNLVFVSQDDERKDSCGRQIERQTSAPYKTQQNVHGFYWRFPDDEPNPYTSPVSV